MPQAVFAEDEALVRLSESMPEHLMPCAEQSPHAVHMVATSFTHRCSLGAHRRSVSLLTVEKDSYKYNYRLTGLGNRSLQDWSVCRCCCFP